VSAWLSIKEAAARSGFSTKTLYRAIAAGELRAKKVRSRWRIAVSDLEAWLLPLPAKVRAVTPRAAAPAEVGSLAALRLIETGRR
jgi:excisionase family DNA binding protein